MKQVIVIPARMSGTRLPGKPLIDINGKPMIQHVWERCAIVHPQELIYIATEDSIICDFCTTHGINFVNTGPAETAIDRIKLFSDVISADSYINIQGDEPIVNVEDIRTLLKYNRLHPSRTCFGRARASEDEFRDHTKAKVVCDSAGKLLYASRAGIPVDVNGNFSSAFRAIWLYSFTKSSLDAYHSAASTTYLDKLEETEINRFLEISEPVYCVDMIGDSWAVDVPKDVLEVINRLKSLPEQA